MQIKNTLGAVLWEGDAPTIKEALEAAVAARANLDGANLRSANLDGANLSGAYLDGAYLSGAYLSGANLSGAYLSGAYLSGATVLDTGETWAEYITEVVPALLTAGGKKLEEFADHWQCHTWANCPMAFAFDVRGLDDVPVLHRPRARQFINFFDAKLIRWPLEDTLKEKSEVGA